MGKGIQGRPADSDNDSMDEERTDKQELGKKLTKKIAKRPRGPKDEPKANFLVDGKNLMSSSATKVKIRSAMKLKKLSKINPSILKEFKQRQQEELETKLKAPTKKMKRDNIGIKVLTKGQKKREKKKVDSLRKKEFVKFLQNEVTEGKGQFEERDKKGVFSMNSIGKTLDIIEKGNGAKGGETKAFVGVMDKKAGAGIDGGMMVELNKRNQDVSGIDEVQRVGKIMKHQAYAKNPLATLKAHITNTLKSENKF